MNFNYTYDTVVTLKKISPTEWSLLSAKGFLIHSIRANSQQEANEAAEAFMSSWTSYIIKESEDV